MECKSCGRQIIGEEHIECAICHKPVHKTCSIKDGLKKYCDMCYVTKSETDEEVKEDIVLLDVIRRSYLESYRTCPFLAYHYVVKGMEFQNNTFALLGIDLHELFYKFNLMQSNGEHYEDVIMKRHFKELYDKYEDTMFEADLILYKERTLEEHKAALYQQGLDCIDTFYFITEEYLRHKPFAIEEKLIIELDPDLPKVSITMDRIDEVDDELEIIDYKTGNVLVGKALEEDMQVPLYIHVVKNHYKKPVRKFTLYYLEENKERTFHRRTDDTYVCTVGKREYIVSLRDTVREVKKILVNMQKGKFSIPSNFKSMYFSCKVCPLKKEGGCDGAETESWKQLNPGNKFSW